MRGSLQIRPLLPVYRGLDAADVLCLAGHVQGKETFPIVRERSMAWPPETNHQQDDADTSLEGRLTRSAPSGTTATHELEEEVIRLAARTRQEASGRRRTGRLRLSRGAAVGLAACVLLGGGAAAVAVVELRSYWSDMETGPHGSYSFELPSGAECEVEKRMLSMGPPGIENTGDYSMTDEQEAFARDMNSDVQSRVDEFVGTDEFQDQVEAQKEVPSDEEWTDDAAYFLAVDSTLSLQLNDDYGDAMDEIRVGGYSMGHSCPGADFDGTWLDEYGDMDDYEAEREESGG